ncbi:MAG TPA: DoxX family protein [Chthoniobacterales bacterium]|jgi:putative oxidoreductase
MNALDRYHGIVFSIMRIIVGLLFAEHGGQKLLGFPPGGHGAGAGLMAVGAWIELVGGLLVAIGLFTRVAAFISSGEMAVAYFMMHAKGGFFPIVNHGEAAVIYCFIFLFIVFYGAGPWSLDALIWRSRTPATGTPLRA